jgi:hypothetical protein
MLGGTGGTARQDVDAVQGNGHRGASAAEPGVVEWRGIIQINGKEQIMRRKVAGHLFLLVPDSSQEDPEQLIPAAQPRPQILALEHTDLLTQCHDFESQAISRAKEGTGPPKDTHNKSEQGSSLHEPVVIQGCLLTR